MAVNRYRWIFVVSALALAGGNWGCGDDAAGGAGAANNGAANNGGGTNNGTDPAAALRYVSDATVPGGINTSVELKLEYVNGAGGSISNATVTWEISGDAQGAQLDARTSTTDGAGVASMMVRLGTAETQFTVNASVTNPAVAPLPFTVVVSSKAAASYIVNVIYSGARDYTGKEIKVSLYKDPERCTDYNPLQPGTPERSEQRALDAGGFPMTFTFRDLPNGDRYTAVAQGLAIDSSAAVVLGSVGCDDSRPAITNGFDTQPIVVEMTDRLPDVTGTWQITSRFDLGEALPAGVQAILNPILDFFADPAGTLVALASDFLEGEFGIGAGSIRSILEAVAEDLLDAAFNGNQTIRDVLTAGGDIGEIIRRFHLQGTLTIPDEVVSATGQITQAQVAYFNLGYRWRLNCDEGENFDEDPTCGDAFISLSTAGLNPVEGRWDGAVTPNPNYNVQTGRIWSHELSVARHTVDFNYGAVAAFLLEKVALPLLFDPTVDSLNALLNRFINCEQIFADDPQVWVTVCETAVAEVSNLLRAQLLDLSYSNNNFTLATPDAAPCPLYEQAEGDYGAPEPPNRAHDPKFKEMGKDLIHPDHGDLSCEWDATLQFSEDPNNRSSFTGRWVGRQ